MQINKKAIVYMTKDISSEGSMSIPVVGGNHLKEDMVGASFANYDFEVNLAHFKGHAMGGFGINTPQDMFLESTAEAAKGVVDYVGENIIYITVMNNLSVDFDCDSHPAKPEIEDIGILVSLDPVA